MNTNNFSNHTINGTSQDGRSLKGLDFDYVKIDERSFEDLLVFSVGFSKLINYYNLNNKVEGDWSDFLTDETVIIATMIDSDPGKIEIQFKNNIYKAKLFNKKEKKVFYLKKCFNEIHEIALRFQYWYTRLKAVESYTMEDSSVKQEVENAIISKLSDALGRLKALNDGAFQKEGLDESFGLDFEKFDEVWRLKEVSPNIHVYQADSFKNKIYQVTEELELIFQSFYETLLYLKIKAPDYMSSSLGKDNHYPEVALFLAFLKLFKLAQGNINNLSKRHLDFYYSTVLRQEVKKPVNDKVYLNFSVYDSVPFAEVKKDTEFLAGEDEEGNNILYLADYNFQVNKAQIKKIRNIFIDKNKINARGSERTLYNKALSMNIPMESLIRTPEENITPITYATFGENQENKAVYEKTMDNARLGFAISSPILLLKEGLREICIVMQFSKETFELFNKCLSDISHAEKSNEEEIFVKGFLEAFTIQITAEKDWLPVTKYVISRDKENYSLKIEFDIESSEAPIVCFNKSVHQGYFNTSLPLIQFILNNDSYIYPYTLLKDIRLEEVAIYVRVSEMKDLILHNNIGQMSADNPFYPFGPLPNTGSYLMIGNNEVFQKSLDSINLNIEWFDLPKHKSGFSGHYKEYNLDIDNASFEAKISILDGGRWIPEESEQQSIKLFRTKDDIFSPEPTPKGTLSDKTYLTNINIAGLKLAANYSAITENLVYSNTSRRGFIKIELSKPEHAFAHSIYPTRLSEVTINNSTKSLLKIANPKLMDIPKQPYAPQIKSISLDYSSSAVISLRDRSRKNDETDMRGNIYHIHPFGEQLVYPDTSKQFTKLLPDYNYEGALLIGFSNLNPPQIVSFLFEMYDEYSITSEQDPPIIEWHYLANNEWYYLRPSKILGDETNGFIKTGIITVEIPQDINRNNTILDPELFWIRASVLKNINVASRTVSVYTQVMTATLSNKISHNSKHLDKSLPAFTINRSINNIEGVQNIVQPVDSFNGLAKEKEDKFYVRIAETLRHKRRAVMAWDYERIILERFPAVYKVACLPNMNSNNLDAPGSVLIVVTPYGNKISNPLEPIASSELLYNIKNYIKDFISPFVKLEVRNPSYERIKIICSVKFIDGYNYGFFIQKLNEELNRYLSNNIDSDQPNIELGGKVNSSDILSFMRTLPYVDFITRFSIVQAARDFNGQYVLLDTAREGDPKASLKASKPWSVLVPAEEHQITVMNEKMEERSEQAGIDALELGHDFIIE